LKQVEGKKCLLNCTIHQYAIVQLQDLEEVFSWCK